MQRESCDGTTMFGNAPGVIDGFQLAQELARLAERGRRRRIEPAQLERVADTRDGQLESERREIGLENFGRGPRHQLSLLDLGPQAIADARRESAGAAAALFSGSAIHPHRLQSRHSRARREARDAGEAAVDDGTYALDR